ncbi:MAG: PTS sugar transporter subunit IIB [Fusobacteriaceae bacterium]
MIKLLAVCGNGMGTSTMMKLKAKSILDKNNIKSQCENCSIGQAKSSIQNYNIVISSTHLVKQLVPNNKTIIISLKNILDAKEMEVRLLEALSIKAGE